ncbi:MAG: hypothetical protein ACK575_05940 [Cyanobacteriota bacterium]|jgi:hypothetical protein
MTRTTTNKNNTTNSHRPSRRQRSRAAAPAQVHLARPTASTTPEAAAQPAALPAQVSPEVFTQAQSGQAAAPFQPRALLAPAKEQPTPSAAMPQANPSTTEPTAEEQALASELIHELGMEPAPCTPEAHALLKEAGISPRPAPGEPRGPDDERFSPIAIGHLTHRLLDVKRFLEQLTAEQKQLHETLRLAHLRGDLLHLLAPSSEGWCYQLGDGVLLTRRQGRKQWSYSPLWAELEAQLKARQTYEQATGEATWRHGGAFWDLRGMK